MIERVKIIDYKCLKNIEVSLGNFNVLIGKNNTGKTSFLQYIQKCYCHEFNVFFPQRKKDDFYNGGLIEEINDHIQDKNISLLPHTFLSMLYPFIALFDKYQDNVFLLESPEYGAHYSCLKGIVEFLRCLSVGGFKNFPKVQVICTTYSPYLLDYVTPEEVLIFHKDENDMTKIIPMSSVKGIQEWIGGGGYSLGELWGNWGEEEFIRRATCDTK